MKNQFDAEVFFNILKSAVKRDEFQVTINLNLLTILNAMLNK